MLQRTAFTLWLSTEKPAVSFGRQFIGEVRLIEWDLLTPFEMCHSKQRGYRLDRVDSFCNIEDMEMTS
jgi:hypothetical protein